MTRLSVAVLLLASLGCGGPTPTLPVDMMAFVRAADGSYKSQPVKLTTLTDVTAMKGNVATLIGGARIVVDENDPQLRNNPQLTDAQLAAILLKNEGSEPRASYVEKNGMLWPVDFHTWNMVSVYYNFERAFDYFQGVSTVSMDPLYGRNASKVYYFPDLVFQQQSPDPQTDNAFFYSPVQGFAIVPFEKFQRLPLGMNAGVISHEYAHRVFSAFVYRGASFPVYFSRWQGTSTPQLNLLKAIDEGFADYHAYGVSCVTPGGCDSRFLAPSLPVNDPNVAARDISVNHCMTTGLRTALNTQYVSDFMAAGREYEVGTLLATALYEAGVPGGKHPVVQRAVVETYSDNTSGREGLAQMLENSLQTPEVFTLAAVANAILQRVTDPGVQTALCNAFQDRLQIEKELMPACPASAAGGTRCPRLSP